MFDYEKCVPSEFYDDELSAQLFEFIEQYKIYDGREHTCFFTGHRNMPKNLTPEILRRLKAAVTYLCTKGVTDFHAGGALGFDTLAAMQIIDLRRMYQDIRLILDLPYKNQSVKWNTNQQRIYDFILSEADEVRYVCDREIDDRSEARNLLLWRNRVMVESSLYCIAYFSGRIKSGTGYTLAFAQKNGCEIINLYDDLAE